MLWNKNPSVRMYCFQYYSISGYQDNFKPVYFFLQKDIARTKTLTSKN